ncbi:sigma 54-interacting transcriptional regulator [Brevibacillus humidisoli]|uniref:sigma 54-interacting transcriptional regulator n=1 Tax=Brevibacillus humidisoli TaxID=2895522 RepID=UPI001E629E10|nr:sigma 54-interacting transcriptional regulator [Brevibacillus humidisoli]UFJ42196.1 sigma 54-interacting transcriptional regulator [Brevibacillus humidisoli]
MAKQRLQLEEMLTESLIEFLESICNGVILVDREGIIQYVNKSGCHMLGLKGSEVVSRSITSIAPGTDILQVIREGKPSLRRQIRFGDYSFLVDRTPFVVNGQIVGGISLFQEITDFEEASQKRSEQERELRQFKELVDQLYDGIVMIDRGGTITMINQTYCDFLGTTIEEAVGKHVTEVIENTRMHVVLETGKPELGELMRIGDRELLVSRMPLREGDEIVGGLGKVIFNDLRELRSIVERYNIMERKLDLYRQELKRMKGAKYSFEHIYADHPLMKDAILLAKRVSRTRSSVLILGESGTGKELFAHAIHEYSSRSENAFVRVNCAAIPKDLMEAELFGYEEGAFTGAKKGGKPGKIELAHGGTLFLDEIGDMSLDMQVKLLRVLQEKEVERVGGTRPIPVDIRVIAATHRPLEQLIKENKFREDLYYRLHVFTVNIPPLRVQGESILRLVEHLISKLNKELYTAVEGVSRRVQEVFLSHRWPGNVRELQNVLERAVQLAEQGELQLEHLPPYLQDKQVVREGDVLTLDLEAELAKTEQKVLELALQHCGGNKVRAAQLLGIHRASLYRKIEKYGL